MISSDWTGKPPNTIVDDDGELTISREVGESEVVATSNEVTLTDGITYAYSFTVVSVSNNLPAALYHGNTFIVQSDDVGTFDGFYTPTSTETKTFALRVRGSNLVMSSAVVLQPSLRQVTS